MSVFGKAMISMVLLSVTIVAFALVGLALEPLFGWGIAPVLIIAGTILVLVLSMRYLPRLLFSGFTSPLFGTSRDDQRILSTGKPAKATVLQIGENKWGTITINSQPYLNLKLRIDDGENQPYEVSLNTIIPRVAVPQFQPGAVLLVRVDPENPMKVVLDQAGSREEETNMPSYGGSDWTDEDNRLLKERGILGQATLLEVVDTGKSLNFNPVARVSWEVKVPGSPPYRVGKEIPMPTEAVQQLRDVVGKTFTARVHPLDREKIIVEVRFY